MRYRIKKIVLNHLIFSSVIPPVNVMNVLAKVEVIFSAVSESIVENRLDDCCSFVAITSTVAFVSSPLSCISSKASSLDSTSSVVSSSFVPFFGLVIFFNLYSYKLS